MKIDVLAFAAHPDDVELACSGTMALCKAQGKTTGIIDLTRGELGTRGTPEIRTQEAAAAAKIMGLDVRENLGFRDGFFRIDDAHQLEIIKVLRRYQPDVILINAPLDRHPDHGRGSDLVRHSAFLSGLRRVPTSWDGIPQDPWRPAKVYKYIQDYYLKPSFVVDISAHFETKMEAMMAFKSQFHNPDSDEPATYISSPEFLRSIESRAKEFGHLIGVDYGEGFISERPLKIRDLGFEL